MLLVRPAPSCWFDTDGITPYCVVDHTLAGWDKLGVPTVSSQIESLADLAQRR